MDILLDLADQFILDCCWARIFPIDPHDFKRPYSPLPSKSSSKTRITPITTHNQHRQANISSNGEIDGCFSGNFQSFRHQVGRMGYFIAEINNANLTSNIKDCHRRCFSKFGRDHIYRQAVSIFVIIFVGISFMYLFLSAISYFFFFDHRLKNHPKYLKNQIKMEIICSLKAFGPIDILALPLHLAQVRGHSKLYTHVSDIKGVSCFKLIRPMLDFLNLTEKFQNPNPLLEPRATPPASRLSQYSMLDEAVKQLSVVLRRTVHYDFGGGWFYLIFSYFLFLIFTDFTVYLIHRFEHHPVIYKHIHKTHHKWVIPTPFASYAFHPLDGFLQSLPYLIFVFIFPFNRFVYLFSFLFVTVWTVLIHDSELIVGHRLENYVNGPTHHTLHHLYFSCNYGQYFTWTDKIFSTYRNANLDDKSTLDLVKQACDTKKTSKLADKEAS